VTLASSDKQRQMRLEELTCERRLRDETGFSLSEVEDLRELHRAYLSLEPPGSVSAAANFAMLLRLCGVNSLSEDEQARLRKIIQARFHEGLEKLHVFGFCMHDIFAQQIGGLKRLQVPQSTVELQGQTGFVATILRELARENLQHAGSTNKHVELPCAAREHPCPSPCRSPCRILVVLPDGRHR